MNNWRTFTISAHRGAFRYATAADLEGFREDGYALLRWPAHWEAVEDLVVASQSLLPAAAAERIYSDEELSHIRLAASSAAGECCGDLAAIDRHAKRLRGHARRCGSEDHALVKKTCRLRGRNSNCLCKRLVEKYGLLVTAN